MAAPRSTSAFTGLSLIGIALAGYLSYLHLGLLRGELIGGAACGAAGSVFNCHAVTAGAWGQFLGMPLSLWGIVGYATVFALSLLGRQSDEWAAHAVTLIFVLAAAFVAVDALLLGLMVFVIRFYCLFCLLTYGVNLLLLFLAARACGRLPPKVGPAIAAILPSSRRPATALFWGIVLAAVVGVGSLHAATQFMVRGNINVREQIREFIIKQPRVTVDIAGDPAIGQPGAFVHLVEFSDFFCPACQRASQMNTVILASHRHDTMFVFKHFPLDTACNDKIGRMVHAGACQVAAASECAHLQGKFWPFHDLVFAKGHAYKISDMDGDLAQLGVDMTAFHDCMNSGKGMDAVKRDIAEGGRIGVGSTPTYVVNGVPMSGGISPPMFEEIVGVFRDADR